MLELYSNANRLFPNTLKILLALAEANAEYEFRVVDFSKSDHRKPEFLAINPHGKIPALRDGDVKLAESNAILWYVADKFPAAGLLSDSAGERARILQFVDFSALYLYTNIYDLANHTVGWEPAKRSKDIADRAQMILERALDVLESVLLDQEYITSRLSIADLACAANIHYMCERLKQYAELKPATSRWYSRVSGRPSWKSVVS